MSAAAPDIAATCVPLMSIDSVAGGTAVFRAMAVALAISNLLLRAAGPETTEPDQLPSTLTTLTTDLRPVSVASGSPAM